MWKSRHRADAAARQSRSDGVGSLKFDFHTGETTPARPAMTEDEQLAAALQASLQAPIVTPPSSYAPASSLAGATLESTLAAFGLERLVPVLAQEDIRDVETLALLEAEDLRAMNIPVGTRSKLTRVIQTLQV